MKRLNLHYSEDFRRNKIAGKVYGMLRDKGFDPLRVSEHYNPGLGEMDVAYLFDDKDAPTESDLENILRSFMGVTFRLTPLNDMALTK